MLNYLRFYAIIFVLLLNTTDSNAQEEINTILKKTLSYRGLTEKDITIPITFGKDNSPRNRSRLLLPVVKNMMINPLKSFEFMDNVSLFNDHGVEELIYEMFFYHLVMLHNHLVLFGLIYKVIGFSNNLFVTNILCNCNWC